VRQILDWILDEAGVSVEVVVDQTRVREEEPDRVVGDPTRIREETGWQPERSIEATVREVYRTIAG
jgi:nucleoside-diphosphate-sugar epimerase